MALVQTKTGSGSGTTATVTLDSAPTAGNTLVAFFYTHGTSAGLGVPAGWDFYSLGLAVSTNAPLTAAWRVVQGGDTGATFTTSSAEWCLTIFEYSGLVAVQANLLDLAIGRFTRASTENVTSLNAGRSGLTDTLNEISVAAVGAIGSNTWSGVWSDGYTQRATVASAAAGGAKAVLAVADRTLTTQAEVDPGTTWTTGRRAIAIVVTLRAGTPVVNPLEWAWEGALTTSGATVTARTNIEGDCRLAVSTSADLSAPTYSATVFADTTNEKVVALPIVGLAPSTTYHWAVEVQGALTPQRGTFTTLPPDGASSFTFGVGSCAKYRTNGVGGNTWPMSFHPVWDVIEAHDPLFFVHMGDLHYQDSDSTDPALHTQPIYDVLQSQKQGPLWQRLPVVYMYDDHDFCGNNTVGTTAASRDQAVAAQRLLVPAYPRAFTGATDALHFSFTVGRVRFIYPDRFADASTQAAAETSAKTLVGVSGRAWLEAELADAEADSQIGLIVLVLGTMWIVDANSGWGQWSWERDYLGNIIAGLTTGVVGLAGDGHMSAIDDGSNNQWGGFPLFHAAAIDHSGVTKGGPYSSGTPIENSGTVGVDGMFGLCTITDDGDTITLDWSGKFVSPAGVETEILADQFLFSAPAAADDLNKLLLQDSISNRLLEDDAERLFESGEADDEPVPPPDLTDLVNRLQEGGDFRLTESSGGRLFEGAESEPPTPPIPAASASGSWRHYAALMLQAAAERLDAETRPLVACPLCGEPLESGRGVLHCRFDGSVYSP